MRVGIDVTPLLRAKTGIGVCTELVLECLREGGHEIVGLMGGWRRLGEGRLTAEYPVAHNWVPRILNPLFFDLLEWPSAETLLGRIDLFVATNYLMLPTREARRVAILHDVGRLRHPELYGRRQVWRARFTVQRCMRLADRIIVPTQAVAHELEEMGLAGADRIDVVPLSARPLPPPGRATRAGGPSGPPFLLCVTSMERRKNLPLLLRAFERAAEALPDHHLIIAGGGGADAREVEALLRTTGAAPRIHLQGPANAAELGALYHRADVTLCPSLYEGFGLTLLEAMSCGCPVVASDIPPHREVGGEAVRLVPARDEGGFAEALVEVARDPAAREAMSAEGLRRSGAFAWSETRRRFSEVLLTRAVPASG